MNPPVPDLTTVDDRTLMRRHVDGDTEAFAEIFRRHKDRLWAVALRVCRDPDIAADAVQDGFLSAFRRADSYRGDAAVTTWLHRIIVNACLDRLRRIKPTDEWPRAEIPDPRDATSEVDTRLLVEAALATLPEAQRLALILVDMQGLPVRQAAEVLGVAEGTVKSRCARGRAALATVLAPSIPGLTPPHGTVGGPSASETSEPTKGGPAR